jgi:quinol monooxygenase YgiN
MIHVLAIVTARPGTRARFLEACRANLPAVLAEEGCLAYEAVVDVAPGSPRFAKFGPDVFVVVERWASLAALQAHAVAPHMKAYAAQVEPWRVSTDVHVLEAA